GAEIIAAVQEGQAPCQRVEIERPVEGRIAASDDKNIAVTKVFHLLDRIEDGASLISIDAGDWRLLGLKRSASCCNDDNLGAEDQPAVGLKLELTVLTSLKCGDHLIEVELRMEGLDLFEQPMSQLGASDHRHARNIVDRLLRIKLGALAAGAVENIDHLTLDIEKTELENRKQPAWPRANDH